jgi:hypothetical protein
LADKSHLDECHLLALKCHLLADFVEKGGCCDSEIRVIQSA